MQTDLKENKKKTVKINVAEMNVLIAQAELGEKIELFKGFVELSRLRSTIEQMAKIHYFNTDNEEFPADHLEDVRLLSNLLEELE